MAENEPSAQTGGKMKIILANPEKSLGLVIPENQRIEEAGTFSLDLLLKQIDSLEAFRAFGRSAPVINDEVTCIRIAFTKDNRGRSAILMRPAGTKGEGWIALCNRTEAGIMTSENNDSPQWVIEVRKEIKRLQRRIAGIQKKIDSDRQTSYDYEDLDNWTGWLHGLKWCLKMRDGKATRKDAWGKRYVSK